MRPSDKERARMIVQKARPSISGQNGHGALYAVACALVVGFDLNDVDAYELISEYNMTASPAWSEKDLRRKLDQARQYASRHPEKVGELARANKDGYTGPVSSPPNKPAPKPTPQKQPTGQPKGEKGARTLRTPFFNVRTPGERAEPRTVRTLRTLPSDSFKPPTLPSSSPHIKQCEKRVSEESERKVDQSAPVQPSPLTKAPPTPKPKYVAPERVDTTKIWADGTVTKKPWGKPARTWNLNDDPRKCPPK